MLPQADSESSTPATPSEEERRTCIELMEEMSPGGRAAMHHLDLCGITNPADRCAAALGVHTQLQLASDIF
jgi:hypothetical protein